VELKKKFLFFFSRLSGAENAWICQVLKIEFFTTHNTSSCYVDEKVRENEGEGRRRPEGCVNNAAACKSLKAPERKFPLPQSYGSLIATEIKTLPPSKGRQGAEAQLLLSAGNGLDRNLLPHVELTRIGTRTHQGLLWGACSHKSGVVTSSSHIKLPDKTLILNNW
jgi:hypothetical protein